MASTAIPQLAMVPRDKHGNDIMSLTDMGLDGSIRTYRFGGRLYFSKIDVAMGVTGKNSNDAGKDLRNLSDETTAEIDKDSIIHKFQGPGQKEVSLITFTGCIKLTMALPGKNAKLIRAEFAGKLMRFYAGDASLVAEIERNRESTNPVNVAAREELNSTEGVGDKRKVPELTMDQVEDWFKTKYAEMQKDFKNQRRLTLGDERRDAKKKKEDAELETKKLRDAEQVRLDAKQKEYDMDLKKQEEDLTILAKRIPLLKQHDEIEQSKFHRDMLRMDKERELKSTTSAPEALPSGDLTARNIGEFYGIFEDVHECWIIRISNSASNMIQKDPYNIKPQGYTVNEVVGKRQPYFASKNVLLMRDILKYCKMDENKYVKDLSTNPNAGNKIPTAVVVESVHS